MFKEVRGMDNTDIMQRRAMFYISKCWFLCAGYDDDDGIQALVQIAAMTDL
jgi:hypothetical protein